MPQQALPRPSLRNSTTARTTRSSALNFATNASATYLQNRYAAGFRLVDLDVLTTSPLRFTASYIKNVGSHYAPGAKFYYNMTYAQLLALVNVHKVRFDSLEPYVIAGKLYFAVAVRSNSGKYFKSWAFRANHKSASEVRSALAALKQRPIDMKQYVLNGVRHWCWTSIANTGADKRAWEYISNLPQGSIKSTIETKKKRVYLMNRVAPGTYDLILTPPLSARQALLRHDEHDSPRPPAGDVRHARDRPRALQDRHGRSYYNALLLNNSSRHEANVGRAIWTRSNGEFGWYLWDKDRGVLTKRREAYGFEPAHTITLAHLLHALREVRFGRIKLSDKLSVYTSKSGDCPTGSGRVFETLETVLKKMMQGSTTRTRAIELRFGRKQHRANRTQCRHDLYEDSPHARVQRPREHQSLGSARH